jgi:hypothetical protein
MTATINAQDFRTSLEAQTVKDLTDIAQKDFQVAVAPKTRKADIITAIVAAKEERDSREAREAQEREEAAEGLRVLSLEEQKADLAALKDHPENNVSPFRPGTSLTREEIQARIAASRKETAEATEAREAAEASKPRRGRDISTDELVKRYGKIGYGVGLMIQATARLTKETKVADEVAAGLGEEMDRDTWDQCRDAMLEGFAKCWDTYGFPSKAMRGMASEMAAGIWAEMKESQPGLAIFAELEGEEGGED